MPLPLNCAQTIAFQLPTRLTRCCPPSFENLWRTLRQDCTASVNLKVRMNVCHNLYCTLLKSSPDCYLSVEAVTLIMWQGCFYFIRVGGYTRLHVSVPCSHI